MTAGLLLSVLLATAAAVRPITVSVGGPPEEPAYLPVYAAAALGTFADEGVQVTVRRAKHPTAAMTDLRDGAAAVAVTTMDQAVRGGPARGTLVRIVSAHTRAPALAVLVSPRHRAEVTSLADLRGRRVGTPGPGTTGALVLTALLRAQRIEPWQVHLLGQSGAALLARLASGDLVAAAVEEPWASRALAGGGAAALVDLRRPEDAARSLSGPFYEVVSATRAAEKELTPLEPALAAYARALSRVQAWLVRTAPADVVARLPASVTANPERLAARLEAQREALAPTGEATAPGVDATLAILESGSPWPAAIRVSAKTIGEPVVVTEARAPLLPNPPDP